MRLAIFFKNIFTLAYPHNLNRIAIYDFLRGIAMLLVIMQHSYLPCWEYILTFHMPLFFFLSGLVAGGKQLPSFKESFITRFKRLMIPYFVFGVVNCIIWWGINTFIHHNYNIQRALLGLITGQLGYVPASQSGIFWFLFVVFIAELLVFPIRKFFNNKVLVYWLGVILFAVLSFATTHWITLSIFTLDKSFMAASFILFGSLMRPVGYIITSEKKRWTDVIIIVVACFGVWLSKTQNSALVLMYKNQYGDYFWFFLGALCGIIAVLYVGKYLYLLVKNPTNYIYKMTMWVGFNSLVLFPVHIM